MDEGELEMLERTGVKRIGHGVEHSSVHVRVDGPIGRGVVERGHKHRIPLCDRQGQQIHRHLFRVSLKTLQNAFRKCGLLERKL